MRDWRADIRGRLAAAALDPASEAEIVEELAQHLEDQYRELRSRGTADDEADAALIRTLDAPGFPESVLSRTRARRAAPAPIGAPSTARTRVGAVWHDVRYGLRSLRRAPALATVAVLSLGIGIGATTAIFGLLNTVLLERMPVPHPEQLFSLQWTAGTRKIQDRVAFREFDALVRAPGMPSLAAADNASMTLTVGALRDNLSGDVVTGSFFGLLGVRPLLGRVIDARDDAAGAPVAVIGEDYWRNHFDSDPATVGRTVSLNGQPFSIIGVLPHDYHGLYFAGGFSVAIPLGARRLVGLPDLRGPRDVYLSVVGRAAPGTNIGAAGAALDRAYRQCCLALEGGGRGRVDPSANGAQASLLAVDLSRGLTSRKVDLRGEYRQILIVLMAGVTIVLLIACANVGDLLLARAAARQRELAVRMSLGATRARLVQQLLTESLELAIAGGALGWVLAWLGTRVLSHNLPPIAANLSSQLTLRPSPVLLGFTAAVSIGCTLLFGVVPALSATRADIVTPLKDGARRRGARWSLDRALVVVQVSLALVLVCAATLFVATLRNLEEADGGYRTTRVLVAYVDTRGTSLEQAGIGSLSSDIVTRLTNLPGVKQVAAGTTLPVVGGMRSRYEIAVQGYTPQVNEDASVSTAVVTPDFFAATGIGLRAGREFDAHDLQSTEQVAIVNAAFVKRYLGNRDPLGATIDVPGDQYQRALHMRIVGIASDAHFTDLRAPASEMLFIPVSQAGIIPYLMVAIRTTGDPNDVAPMVSRELAAVAPDLRARRLVGVEQVLDEALSRERLSAALATIFGVFALLLAAVGLYGVVAYNVSRRTSEIGVRVALGARPADTLWLVVRQTLTMTGVGIVIGAPLAIVTSRAIGAQLYGIAAGDPRVMIGAALVLGVAGAVASVVPARRASRVDPVVALRAE